MTAHIQTRLFENHADALAALHDLKRAGFTQEEISLLRNGGGAEGPEGVDGLEVGAAMGTLLGSGVGLAAGLGALTVPGFGPLVAAGWLVATLAGAGVGVAAGSLVGTLVEAGVQRSEAEGVVEALRQGGTLVMVRTDAARSERAATLLANHLAVRSQEHGGKAAGPEGAGAAILSAPAPGTPGNPAGG